jgi:hypothetical protein
MAEMQLEMGDPDGAARACRAGLGIDRFHDPLWRLLVMARDRAGDAGAATRARQEYESVLATLGLDSPVESAAGTRDGSAAPNRTGRNVPTSSQAAPLR